MRMNVRTMDQVIADIIAVTKKEGFIYALLMIIRRDVFLMLEEYHLVNNREVLITWKSPVRVTPEAQCR